MDKTFFEGGSTLNADGNLFKKNIGEALCKVIGKAHDDGYSKLDITRVIISTAIGLRDLSEFKRMLLKAKIKER